MTQSVNMTMAPGFTVEVVQGANVVLSATVYDRAGNVIDLTGYGLKFAVKRVIRRSNGAGQLTNQDVPIFEVSPTIVNATLGNITIPLSSAYTGTPGSYEASLRIWDSVTTTRSPDDAYAGTLFVAPAVVR